MFKSSVFEITESPLPFERKSFKFKHALLGHPALELDNLARVAQELPPDRVFFSGLVPKDANFDRAHVEYSTGLTLKQTVENMMTSSSYVMIRAPETHPSFRELFGTLLAEVESLMRAQGIGGRAFDPMLYLFIASPGSVTPFHIDRYSTVLMQFRGRKEVHISPAWDERVATAAATEAFVVRAEKLPYNPAFDERCTRYEFGPGDAVHIPFVAPHYVKNGADDVSVSLSIIFNTAETMRHLRVMHLNDLLRRRLRGLRIQPMPANQSAPVDRLKSGLDRGIVAVTRLGARLRRTA